MENLPGLGYLMEYKGRVSFFTKGSLVRALYKAGLIPAPDSTHLEGILTDPRVDIVMSKIREF